MSLRNHKMVAISLACFWKEQDGMKTKSSLKIPNPKNYIQVALYFIIGLPMIQLLPQPDRKTP